MISTMIKYIYFNPGCGPVTKIFKQLGINAVCVGIVEYDITSLFCYYYLYCPPYLLDVPPTPREIIDDLQTYPFMYNDKPLILQDLTHPQLRKLYKAHHATNNLRIENIECDLIIFQNTDIIPFLLTYSPSYLILEGNKKNINIKNYLSHNFYSKIILFCKKKILFDNFIPPIHYDMYNGYNEKDYNILAKTWLHEIDILHLFQSHIHVDIFYHLLFNLFIQPLNTLRSTIIVPSEKLEIFQIENNILSILKKKYEKTSQEKHGFIINVLDIENINEAYVSTADNNNIFDVSYIIQSTKPKLNNFYDGMIIICQNTGIMVSVNYYHKIGFKCNILILPGNYSQKTKSHTFSCPNGCNFKLHDQIHFQIIELTYDNEFICIGKHIC